MSSAPALRLVRSNANPQRGSRMHHALALTTVVIFAILCLATYAMITLLQTEMETWAATIVGSVLGYWANNVAQVLSCYFGSSFQPQEQPQATAVAATVTQPAKRARK